MFVLKHLMEKRRAVINYHHNVSGLPSFVSWEVRLNLEILDYFLYVFFIVFFFNDGDLCFFFQ